MAAWLAGMVGAKAGVRRQLKLDIARDWWVGGLAFYVVTGWRRSRPR